MPAPKIIGAQRDFSAGEIDEALKRADEMPFVKTGCRQMVNWRVLSGGQAQNRPGRRALFLEKGRVEEVEMSPGQVFFLVFGDGYVRVYNYAGTRVAQSFVKGDGVTRIPWTTATAASIVFCVVPLAEPQIVITYGHDFPLNVPIILTWDGASQTSSWTITNFAEALLASGQKRTIFDRLSEANVTIVPSAITGSITLTASAAVFTPGMVGCHLLWCGREVLITGYVNAEILIATVVEQLPNAVNVEVGQFVNIGNGNEEFVPGINGYFLPGDLVEGATSGTRGIVISTMLTEGIVGTAQDPIYATVVVAQIQIIPTASQSPISYFLPGTVGLTQYFIWQENIVGTNGNGQVGASTLLNPLPVSVWDDEVMNNYRGWPISCFYDQSRLGFCGFACQPNSIAWSSIGLTNDFYVNGLATSVNADNAIYEQAPGGSQVYFVVPGMESSEFVFCSNAIFYIAITPQLPLTPGSVSFNMLSSQGSYPNIKPQQIQQSILYVRAGGASLGAVQTPGYYFRPNVIDIVSEYHSHLFTAAAPVALAVPQAPTQFEENYAYLLRADGVVVVTKYLIRNGLLEPGPDGKPKMGWVPWTGVGVPTWITAQGGDLVFTTNYENAAEALSDGFSNGYGDDAIISVVEILDNTQALDGAITVVAPPAPLAAPPGYGPLWWIAGGSVTLLDNGRQMGLYEIGPTGFIVPQFIDGENLTSGTLIAGQAWTAMLEPFSPDAPPGTSARQRMSKRRVSRMAVYVSNSTGFMMARLFSGPLLPDGAGPALGATMNSYRVEAYNQGDDPAQPAPLREEVQRWRPLGRAFDPRVAVIKDTPGAIIIHEIGIEVTV